LVQIQIAMDTAINVYPSDPKGAIKMFFAFFNSYFDSLIAEKQNKRFHDYVRPPTAMQCLFEGQTITSWKGPYQGVGDIAGKTWKAFFAAGRVNNGGPEFPCGHCITFAASMNIMKLYFGSDEFRGNNITTAEGTNQPEPKITSGTGFISGVTDVPNTGFDTVGYSPATDIPLGWSTWTAVSDSCSISRIYLGAHTIHSTVVGRQLGTKVAEKVWAKTEKYFNNDKSAKCKPIGEWDNGNDF